MIFCCSVELFSDSQVTVQTESSLVVKAATLQETHTVEHFPTLPLIMQVVTPPHSLEELLTVMAVKDEITVGSVDQVCDICS